MAVSGFVERPTFLQRVHIDLPLFFGLVVLAAFGVFVVHSASGNDDTLVARHLVRLTIAFGVMLALAQVKPRHLYYWTPWVYGFGLILLIVVLVVGDIGKGAQRWISFGPVNFQPSELVKVSVPMMIASYLGMWPRYGVRPVSDSAFRASTLPLHVIFPLHPRRPLFVGEHDQGYASLAEDLVLDEVCGRLFHR